MCRWKITHQLSPPQQLLFSCTSTVAFSLAWDGMNWIFSASLSLLAMLVKSNKNSYSSTNSNKSKWECCSWRYILGTVAVCIQWRLTELSSSAKEKGKATTSTVTMNHETATSTEQCKCKNAQKSSICKAWLECVRQCGARGDFHYAQQNSQNDRTGFEQMIPFPEKILLSEFSEWKSVKRRVPEVILRLRRRPCRFAGSLVSISLSGRCWKSDEKHRGRRCYFVKTINLDGAHHQR